MFGAKVTSDLGIELIFWTLSLNFFRSELFWNFGLELSLKAKTAKISIIWICSVLPPLAHYKAKSSDCERVLAINAWASWPAICHLLWKVSIAEACSETWSSLHDELVADVAAACEGLPLHHVHPQQAWESLLLPSRSYIVLEVASHVLCVLEAVDMLAPALCPAKGS